MTKKSRRFFYTVFREVKTLEIYLDLVFLENFLMDFILLLMVGKMIHKTICLPRLLAAAFLGGISAAVLCLLHPQFVLLQVCNLIAGLCMLLLSYPLKRLEYLPALLFLYGSAFVLEGMLRFLGRFIGSRGQHRLYFLLGTGLFGWLFFHSLWKQIQRQKQKEELLLPVTILWEGKQIDCTGLLDTGNALREPTTGKPVMIVEQTLFTEHEISLPNDRCFLIPFRSIGRSNGMLRGILAEECWIGQAEQKKRYRKVMLGIYHGKLSHKAEYQVILHPAFWE